MKLNEYEIVMSQAADKMTELYDTIATLHHNLANAQATVEMAMARAGALEAKNARLQEALKPFATIANLNGFPRGVDVTLWRRSTNEPGVEDITIKLSDCKRAYVALNANP